jgi:flagellar assembly protein FliH
MPIEAGAIVRPDPEFAGVEREAYARGYEQGSRAATESSRVRTDAMLVRLGETMTELESLRRRLLPRIEREVIDLALAIAARIVRREISIDRELVLALARVALERVGDRHSTTVRLNPEDFAFAVTNHGEQWIGDGVTAVADPDIPRGGCRIESPFGSIDTGIEAQLSEIARGILPDADEWGPTAG